jgi:hypothetical protein
MPSSDERRVELHHSLHRKRGGELTAGLVEADLDATYWAPKLYTLSGLRNRSSSPRTAVRHRMSSPTTAASMTPIGSCSYGPFSTSRSTPPPKASPSTAQRRVVPAGSAAKRRRIAASERQPGKLPSRSGQAHQFGNSDVPAPPLRVESASRMMLRARTRETALRAWPGKLG